MVLQLLRLHGAGEPVALHPAAAQAAQALGLLLRLHALGDDLGVQAAGHPDHGGEDGAGAVVVLVAGEELHVQLQHVHGDVLQNVQAGMACAEVVQLHGEAGLTQAGDLKGHELGVFRADALRDLQMELGGGQLIAGGQADEAAAQVVKLQIVAGDVDGHGEVKAHIAPAPDPAAGLFPHDAVQLGDQVAVLQQRDELAGGDQAAGGMLPAHKGLRADEDAAGVVELGLKPDLELILLQGGAHIAEERVLPLGALAHVRGVVGDAPGLVAEDGLLGQQGLVDHGVGVAVRLAQVVDAHVDLNGVIQLVAAAALEEQGVALLRGEAVVHGAEADELIRAQVAGEAVRAVVLVEVETAVLEQVHAGLVAEGGVDVAEIVEVEEDQTVGAARVVPQPAVHTLDEAVGVVEGGEGIDGGGHQGGDVHRGDDDALPQVVEVAVAQLQVAHGALRRGSCAESQIVEGLMLQGGDDAVQRKRGTEVLVLRRVHKALDVMEHIALVAAEAGVLVHRAGELVAGAEGEIPAGARIQQAHAGILGGDELFADLLQALEAVDVQAVAQSHDVAGVGVAVQLGVDAKPGVALALQQEEIGLADGVGAAVVEEEQVLAAELVEEGVLHGGMHQPAHTVDQLVQRAVVAVGGETKNRLAAAGSGIRRQVHAE